MIENRIKQAKKLQKTVNICRELVKFNGAYNPDRYKHYLVTKYEVIKL